MFPPFLYTQVVDSLAKNLWDSNDSKDFTFIIGSQEIKAHKCILTNYSPILKVISETENILEITEYSYDVVETAIKFRYEIDSFHCCIVDDLISIMKFADQYEIDSLKAKVEGLLISKINGQNICKLSNASIVCNAELLKTKCCKLLKRYIHSRRGVKDVEILDNIFAKEFLIKTIPKNHDFLYLFGPAILFAIIQMILLFLSFELGKNSK